MPFADMILAASARRVVEVSAAVRPNENVCVVTDTNKLAIAEALAKASAALGAETVVCIMTPRRMHGNEPPAVMAGAMRVADVILAPTTYAITHTDARIAASRAGARTIILRGITEDTFVNGAMQADYAQIHALGSRLAARFGEASRIRMTSPGGSDISMSVAGQRGLCLGGLAREAGTFTSLPSGETAIVPVEGTAEGVVVADHAVDGLGLLSEPIRLTVAKGRVTRIEGGSDARRLLALVEGADANANNFAEFAIGLNPLSRMLGNLAEDKILRGCVHVAVGDSHTIGGAISSEIHLDHVVLRPTVWLDDEVIVKDGQLLAE